MTNMPIKKNGLIFNDKDYFYLSDNEFMFEGTNYERDAASGRCYCLEHSSCLRADCDGKLVRRRMRGAHYLNILNKLKRMIPSEEDLKQATG